MAPRNAHSLIGHALSFSSPGKDVAEILNVQEFECQEPAADHALLQLIGAPVNPLDLVVIAGAYPLKPRFSVHGRWVPGDDGCFRILRVGSGVTDFASGDLVIPRALGFGTWRTHATVPTSELIKIPNNCADLRMACLLRMSVLPAYLLIQEVAAKPGDWVILNAATSSIAHFLVQFARLRGLRTVSIFRDRELASENEQVRRELRDNGATLALTEKELALQGLPASMRIVAALDAVWGSSGQRLLESLGSGGTFTNYGRLAGSGSEELVLMHKAIFVKGINVRAFRSSQGVASRSHVELSELYAWFVELANDKTLSLPKLSQTRWSGGLSDMENALLHAVRRVQDRTRGTTKPLFLFDDRAAL